MTAAAPVKRRKPRKAVRGLRPRHTQSGALSAHIDKFCKSVAEGISGAESYRAHVATQWVATSTATSEACKLLAKTDVRERVEWFRASAKGVLEQMGFTKDTALRFLAEAVTTPVGELTEDHPHTQELVRTRLSVGRGEDAEEWEVEKIKGVNKLDAIKQLAAIAGWNATEKVQVTHCTSADVNAALDKMFAQD